MATGSTSSEDRSPASPSDGDVVTGTFETARNLANYGRPEDAPLDKDSSAKIVRLAPLTMSFDWSAVTAFLHACMTCVPRVKYGLGAKIPSTTSVPGVDFSAVDCSGFVRAIVLRFVTPHIAFPDGSSVQHDWVDHHGYVPAKLADGGLADNKVRIAFLNAADTSDKIGHVLLIRNGATVESHGGIGPDSRAWGSQKFMAKMHLYLLSD